MTSSQTRPDFAAYSRRTCRCGAEMRRLTSPDRQVWECPACGRRQKR